MRALACGVVSLHHCRRTYVACMSPTRVPLFLLRSNLGFGNQLTGTIPSSWGSLSGLRYLCVQACNSTGCCCFAPTSEAFPDLQHTHAAFSQQLIIAFAALFRPACANPMTVPCLHAHRYRRRRHLTVLLFAHLVRTIFFRSPVPLPQMARLYLRIF